jgi:hypothetical protein
VSTLARLLVGTVLGLACFLAPASVAYALWSTTATATMAVTTATATPTLSCGGRLNNNAFSMSWSAVAGTTAYTTFSAPSNSDAAYVAQSTASGTSANLSIGANGTTYWRVRVTSPSTSGWSNTLSITRNGNGRGNFTCVEVTP